jgi:hypothetical protein
MEARNEMASAPDAKTRRFWIDPRFVVGILLIVASVAGVCLLLASQNRTIAVYVARDTLVQGDRVTADDFEVANVRVPASDRYLAAGGIPGSAVVLRTVDKGELVPSSAVGDATRTALTSVVVTASGPISASVAAGSSVDVWAARSDSDKDYEPPVVLVDGAVVVAVQHDDSLVADRGSVSVEVRVPAARVASVLQAIADGRTISVVPAGPDAVARQAGERSAEGDASEGDGDQKASRPSSSAVSQDGSRDQSGSGK